MGRHFDLFGWLGYLMQLKIDFLCRGSILAAPLVLDLALELKKMIRRMKDEALITYLGQEYYD